MRQKHDLLWGYRRLPYSRQEMVCVDLFFVGLFQDLALCEDLVNGGFARSQAALIRSNQCFDEWIQSFTQYACKNLTCDREKAYTPVVGAYRRFSLFEVTYGKNLCSFKNKNQFKIVLNIRD